MFIKFNEKLIDVAGLKFMQIGENERYAIGLYNNINVRNPNREWIEIEIFDNIENRNTRFKELEELLIRL